MTWLTPAKCVYKYVPDVNDTMSRMLKAFTSLRKYQAVITHFLWDMEIIKMCLSQGSDDVSLNAPLVIIKKRKRNRYFSPQCKCISISHLLQLACPKSIPCVLCVLVVHEKISVFSVDGRPYFQCKPTGGCPGTVQPKRLAETPQSCVRG